MLERAGRHSGKLPMETARPQGNCRDITVTPRPCTQRSIQKYAHINKVYHRNNQYIYTTVNNITYPQKVQFQTKHIINTILNTEYKPYRRAGVCVGQKEEA